MDAQRRYLFLVRTNLIALAIGATAGSIVLPAGLGGKGIAAVAAFALVVALVTTLLIQVKSFERTWYGGRAVAESVKTLAWRYMVRAEPFDESRAAEVDSLFADRLSQVLKDSATLNVHLKAPVGDQITIEMREARAASFDTRRDLYAECRIRDQQLWYSANAERNEIAGNRLFLAIWTINAFAILAAICMIIWPTLILNTTGIFATVAASLFAWLQVRRHQELSQSYAVAVAELGFVHSKALHIRSEAVFAEFVADAEAAISREHILWVARRDAGIQISRPT
jgi:hypothetical protein